MAQLIIENFDQTSFRFSPISFRAPRWSPPKVWAPYGASLLCLLALIRRKTEKTCSLCPFVGAGKEVYQIDTRWSPIASSRWPDRATSGSRSATTWAGRSGLSWCRSYKAFFFFVRRRGQSKDRFCPWQDLSTWCRCYKTFFPLLVMTRPNKLEGLSLETLSSQVFEFEGKANWSTFQMFPSWVSSWCYQQMLD